MKSTDSPALFPQVFARDADPRLVNATLPETTSNRGRVSILDGFPELNFTPISLGGEPVNGVDMQTLFHMLSIVARSTEAGQIRPWDSGYSQKIGGYPLGAVVASSSPGVLYISLVDDNLTDPVEDQKQIAGARSWSAVGGSQTADDAFLHYPARYLTGTYDDVDETFFAREQASIAVKLSSQLAWAANQQQWARFKQMLIVQAKKAGLYK